MPKSLCILLILCLFIDLSGQKNGLRSINIPDLQKHMRFLASDELEGRDTGEPGLEIAARYLSVQAEHIGLKTADGQKDYFQSFRIIERSPDYEASSMKVVHKDTAINVREVFFPLPALRDPEFTLEGPVVFAGYGLRDNGNGYDDFGEIDVEGKIVLIMTRGPEDQEEYDRNGLWGKLRYLRSLNPLAVLVVYDPKSRYASLEEENPRMAAYLQRSRSLEGEEGIRFPQMQTFLISRRLADELLRAGELSLSGLQEQIDSTLLPASFDLKGIELKMDLRQKETSMEVRNVFGWIEGSDPQLKEDFLIYMAHYDHVGRDDQQGIFNGADDNASGSAALIEIAEALQQEKNKPARSIGFLWVTAEEIGLYGSRYYAENPLVPLERTSAAINLDMVGRTKRIEDERSERSSLTIVGRDSVKVIGGLQSKLLMEINRQVLKESGLAGDYDYNRPNDPNRYFYRSDHVNFARKDIPVLFYSTGTHADYHRTTDTEDRIDYEKFLKMTEFSFRVGYKVADYPGPIPVDNPMSGW